MLASLTVALLLSQAAPTPAPSVYDVLSAALPEMDGEEPWDYSGARDSYFRLSMAAADHWLDEDRLEDNAAFVWYSAEPSRGSAPFRQVAIIRHQGRWNPETQRVEGGYAYALRLSYSPQDVMAAFDRIYPVQDVIAALGRHRRLTENWFNERQTFYPDPQTVVRTIRVQREALDERHCPALRSALERLNLIEIPPVHLYDYGPDRRPPSEDDIVITADGTRFELVIRGQHAHHLTLSGNHRSIPAQWIEQFETETEGCWQPYDRQQSPG